MIRSNRKWTLLILAVIALLTGLVGAQTFAAGSGQAPAAARPLAMSGPQIVPDSHHDLSPPLRTMPIIAPQFGMARHMHEHALNKGRSVANGDTDTVIQQAFGPLAMPTPIRNFDGMSNQWGVYPPDTNGEVGPNNYVQTVNLGFQIWNKSGTSLYGPADLNTLWAGFGGQCQTRNDGDPIVLYDQLADRWIISQFTANDPGPYFQCIAVSQTGDPTGAWYRYAFQTSATVFGDYPKFGVWPDAYYMTTNEFTGNPYTGTGAYAFDRARMLQGLSATFQYFHLPATNWGGMYPSDLDGSTPPPAGSPNYFLEIDDSAWDPPNIPADQIQFYKFHVDWATPANSTFIRTTVLSPAPFDAILCNFGLCVPQPGTAQKLDTLADRSMFRLAYRNFGTHESLVINDTVDVGTDKAGIRWYEIRGVSGTPAIYQQGTLPAADTEHRWMGSIAQDHSGNMALAYSVSSGTVFPSIRYTGRLVSDPLGQMPQGEVTLIAGTGVQTGSAGRWGDYSDLTVDPTDDCTFWYTNEYYPATSAVGWHTRIGSFKFPQCGTGAATPTVVPPSATPSTPVPTITPGGPTPCPIQFVDVPSNNTFYDFIRCLACRGIVGGYPCGGPNEPCPGTYFRPNNNLTRGQVAKIVANSAGWGDVVPSTQQTYQDVPSTNTFWLFVERVNLHGAISGYPCGGAGEPCVAPTNRPYYRPNNNVTRGQLSKIVSTAAGWSETPTTQTFQDVPSSGTFYLFVERMASRSIISGYPCGNPGEPCVAPANRPYFRPNNSVTRGQASKMVASAFYPNCQTPAQR